MAATQVLAPGLTAVNSADIVVPAGAIHTVGIYTDNAAGIPKDAGVTLFVKTPSQAVVVGQLTAQDPIRAVQGPVTLYAARPLQPSINLGVWKDTA